MSLKEIDRQVMITLELEKAEKTWGQMEVQVNNGVWEMAANRLYYALFHAVSALLIHDHHQVSSHKGSHILFGNYYIKTGILPTEYGALYSQMESIREEGEYNCTYKVTEEELLKRLAPAKEMIDRIAEMVKE